VKRHTWLKRMAFGLVLSLATPIGLAPVWAQPPAGEVVYYHTDVAGSIRMVTDEGGAAIEEYNYAPFGTLVGGQGPGVAQPRGFAGKEHDVDTSIQTGLGFDDDYFGARYYASYTARFTTVDPGHVAGDILNPQSWNGYAYALNNPLRFIDPMGLCSQDGDGNYVDADDAGTLINKGPCPRSSEGALTVGVRETVSAMVRSPIVLLADGISAGAGPAADARVIAGFYGVSAAGGLAFWGGGAFAGAELTTLGIGEVSATTLSNQAAGAIIGWGTRQSGAAATRELTNNLTRAAVEAMKRKGLNRATAQNLLRQYEKAIAQGGRKLDNEQLLPRRELMKRILELW
jgi:RHS repeat-associated protein